MREINREDGKVYTIDEFYFLEKNYIDLGKLIEDEKWIVSRSKKNGFRVVKSNWYMQNNPDFTIESVIYGTTPKHTSPIRYMFKLQLEYTK